MPFFGDALGAYMLPRTVLELLQQPSGQHLCGVCAESGFAWLLSGQQLYIWRYREGKEARLRVLTLPRPPSPLGPAHVVLVPHGTTAQGPSASSGPLSAPASAAPSSAAADGPLSVAICDAAGRLTVWLDANHLASPVEHQLLSGAQQPAQQRQTGSGPRNGPLVAAFTAARLDLGSGAAFLAALSAADGSLHLLQAGTQGIFPKLLSSPAAAAESRGLVGALGSALSRAVTDAFDPSARYLRKQPAPAPALGLHLGPAPGGGGTHYRLLVLTAEALDCWTVSVGLRPSEALQWSFLNGLVRAHDGRRGGPQGVSNLAFAVAGSHVAVWLAEPPAGARPGATERQHAVQLLELLPEGGPGVCSGVHTVVQSYDEPADPPGTSTLRRLLYAPASHTCLLARWQQQQPSASLDPYGAGFGGGARVCRALWSWDAASGAAAQISEDPDTAAIGAATGDGKAAADGGAAAAGRWVVLSATYGVVEVAAVPPSASASAAPSALMPANLGLDLAAAIANLLDAVLSQAAATAAAGGNLQPLVSGLERRLAALGALGTSAGQATLAHYSTQLLDLLPKQWAGGSAAAAAQAASGVATGPGLGLSVGLAEQLSEKESRHALLLQCLALGGVLHALAPEVLRVLVANSEKLAVASALYRLQAHQRDTMQLGQGAAAGAQAAAALLARLVAEAGAESSEKEHEVLAAPEVFYARPSVSVPRFLGALGRAAEEVEAQATGGLGQRGDSDVTSLRASVRELGSLVAVAVNAAIGRREWLAASHHLASQQVAARLGKPDWLASAETRQALDQLAKAVEAVKPAPSPPSQASVELSYTLYGVTDVLLTCFASAVTAVSAAAARDGGAAGGAAARATLVAEYRAVRGRCASELVADALAEMRAAGLGTPAPDLLVWQVEALCRAHHCYPQLFELCEALAEADPGQAGRLYTHMATLPAEEGLPSSAEDGAGGAAQPLFATYVYGRLLDDGRPADLLALPGQFASGVTAFLQSRHPPPSDLLATHLLQTGAFADAAAVLQQCAASAGAGGKGAGGGGKEGAKGALGGHRRMLAVARLAARAGGAAEAEAAALLQLRLLGVQSRLGLPSDGAPMEPAVLLDQALSAASASSRGGAASSGDGAATATREAAVAAVEVLALMPASVRKSHSSKWQLAWRAVYDADRWDELAAARAAQGGGAASTAAAPGGEWGDTLAATAVARAAAACGGSDALGFGASVVDSAPLDQVARWLRTWALAGGSGGPAAGRGSPGAAAAAAAATDPNGARRVEAVMGALRLGVDAACARGSAEAQPPTANGNGGGAGSDFMVVD
ncbi:hypothetical protein HYH03_003192 [Edaphochlamys debaryana]|uniref:Uncharacterized protein n=1 Tax=Edaphochlamys debaryana TaxID=47281 RepID=A0A835YAF6_9CHLO|nr:hypothetical protein HYH03_003192 [Edaphochlamys debaryana]|eukprot:KAG2499006.1 hypothetical protein HYH03_003192 [Edaphochlamys debaryana]